MYVVIFRAKIRSLDDGYAATAARMRELALGQFGCAGFDSVTDGLDEISLSYWPNEQSILAWKNHPEHIRAQRAGRERWYVSYTVQVARLDSEYHVNG